MFRYFACISASLVATGAMPAPSLSQSNPDIQMFFSMSVGPNQNQIAAIEAGQPVSKVTPSRTASEVFLFGAVYIHAAPEAYTVFARDFNRLRKLPNYLAAVCFSAQILWSSTTIGLLICTRLLWSTVITAASCVSTAR